MYTGSIQLFFLLKANKVLFCLWKEMSYAFQAYIYLIKNTVTHVVALRNVIAI